MKFHFFSAFPYIGHVTIRQNPKSVLVYSAGIAMGAIPH